MKKFLALVLCIMMLGTVAAMAEAANPLYDNNPLLPFLPLTEEEGVELDWWTTRMASVADFETNAQTAEMEELTGVHINWTQVALDEKETKLNLSLASGDYPDVYMTAFSTDQVTLYGGDVFIPLEDYITPEITPNLCKTLEENPDILPLITAPDGHIYTLFRTDTGVHMLSQNKVFVNTEWLNAYIADGGKMPETTDEFKAMLVYFRDHDMNGNGDAADEMPFVSSTNGWAANPLYYFVNAFIPCGSGYNPYMNADEEGNITFIANQDAFRDALIYMNELYDEGLLAEETYIQDATQMQALINNPDKTQLVVGCYSAAWQGVYTDTSITAYADYTPIAPIAGPAGVRSAGSCSQGSYAEFLLQCAITTACEDPELAMRYLDLGFVDYVPGQSYDLRHGHVGEYPAGNYTWSEELPSMNGMTPTRVDATGVPAVQNDVWNNHTMPYWDTTEQRYNVYADDLSANKFLYDAHVAYEPFYKFDGFPLLTWCADQDLADEVAELQTAINEYIGNATVQFITGAEDITDDAAWDEYKAELENIGLEDYLAGKKAMVFGE